MPTALKRHPKKYKSAITMVTSKEEVLQNSVEIYISKIILTLTSVSQCHNLVLALYPCQINYNTTLKSFCLYLFIYTMTIFFNKVNHMHVSYSDTKKPYILRSKT